ncbi:MAG TPA: hypothetical protein VGL29_07555, partial [Blastocatellia bacterium]
MLKWSHSTFAAILLIMLSASLSAQNQPKSPATDKPATRQVIASASDDSIRFTSLGELIQMRLEVIGLSGETLFDSDFKPGNVIDWPGSDSKGQRLADGAYLCIVSVTDSSGQLTRRRAIAVLREGTVSMTRPDASTLSAAQAQVAGPPADEDVSATILEPQQSSATAILAHDGATAQLIS